MNVLKYTRNPIISQVQLDDYIIGVRKYIFYMNIPKKYIQGIKAICHVKKEKGRRNARLIPGSLTTFDYWLGVFSSTTTLPGYLKRRKKPKVLTEDNIVDNVVPGSLPVHEGLIPETTNRY
ncbi:MAG: hypothetical protein ACTSXP_16585 [Promethearchaeota archaeon]